MTEAEWLACDHPSKMLRRLVRSKKRRRKCRLFAVACCRRTWHRLTDQRSRRAVEAAERLADSLISYAEVGEMREAAFAVANARFGFTGNRHDIDFPALAAALTLCGENDNHCFKDAAGMASGRGPISEAECAAEADLVREVFGNPFRLVALNPAWRTSTVTALATAAYEERILPAGTLAPDRLAVLADALEDAGCDNTDILSHLRGPEPHVRGCWVIDVLLGKE